MSHIVIIKAFTGIVNGMIYRLGAYTTLNVWWLRRKTMTAFRFSVTFDYNSFFVFLKHVITYDFASIKLTIIYTIKMQRNDGCGAIRASNGLS